jgi:hypothetical protein
MVSNGTNFIISHFFNHIQVFDGLFQLKSLMVVSTNENNNYNKNFSNHQKNQKTSRNVKSSSNEKATMLAMDTNSKESNESSEKYTSVSADEGELHDFTKNYLDFHINNFRSMLEASTTTKRIHIRKLRALSEYSRE